jgi:hypothetical protein
MAGDGARHCAGTMEFTGTIHRVFLYETLMTDESTAVCLCIDTIFLKPRTEEKK